MANPHPPRQRSGTISIGGQEITVNVNLDAKKAKGPIHLGGGEKLPEGIVDARTQQDMHMSVAGESSSSFSNPKQNAYRLGFKEGMKVADLGSGSGAYTSVLSDVVGTTGVVYAVDVQRDLLTRIQNNATREGKENIEIIWGDMEGENGVGIKDELLDGVLLSNTLFQVDDKIAVLKEAWRLLRPGGTLAVIEWKDSFGGLGPAQNMVVTQAEATLLCTDNGFALRSDFKAGEHHYGLVFIKMVAGETDKEVLANTHKKEDNFISHTIAQELI
ncbi:MAG: methyltransferase domain-containing protein [Candidatus Pacebacteria bacterium]|nr:methyltransferase domain-containing protein [Candidatus Paceibacterota bacterium]